MVTRALTLLWLILFGSAIGLAQPLPAIKYDGGARSHTFDVLHIALDVGFDFEREIVFGHVTHTIRSLNPELKVLALDAGSEITITSLTVNGNAASYTHEDSKLAVALPKTLGYNDTIKVEIIYSSTPESGLFFVKKEENERNGRDQIWSQGEGEENHHWIPMYDYPNDLATTEVSGTIRSDWKFLSNGLLVSTKENGDGTTTWHYRMEKPHASYLIMMAAGDYLVTRDTALGVPLEYWSYPDMPKFVEPTFGRTPDVLHYLDSITGIRYPWNKYAQIFINEFMYGGMENTTATTLNDSYLVNKEGLIDYNPDGLIAHELAHQWFGDLVTNRSWDHLWIHESFATYLAARYMGYRYGDEEFERTMRGYSSGAIHTDTDQGRSPIAGGKGYTSNIYGRGAFVLNMLNHVVGEELFWKSIRYFLERHAHSPVQTNDLKLAFEDVTGYNLDWFFDQWVYGAGLPFLQVTQEYDGDSLRLIVRQTQPRDSATSIFQLPLTLEFYSGELSAKTLPAAAIASYPVRTEQAWLADSVDTIAVAIRPEPSAIIVDAGNGIIKKLDFKQSPSALLVQFTYARSMVDRVEALHTLANLGTEEINKDKALKPEPIDVIADRLAWSLEHDTSSRVRQEVMESIATLRPRNTKELLAVGLQDKNSDVRKSAVETSWALVDKAERAALLRPLLNDPSADVTAATMKILATTDPAGLEESLRRFEYVEGPRQHLARAWMEAVGAGKFGAFADRVAWYALNSTSYPTRRTAFETLALLEVTTDSVRQAIVSGLKDKSEGMFNAALSAAKAHGDKQLKSLLKEIHDQLPEDRREKMQNTL